MQYITAVVFDVTWWLPQSNALHSALQRTGRLIYCFFANGSVNALLTAGPNSEPFCLLADPGGSCQQGTSLTQTLLHTLQQNVEWWYMIDCEYDDVLNRIWWQQTVEYAYHDI